MDKVYEDAVREHDESLHLFIIKNVDLIPDFCGLKTAVAVASSPEAIVWHSLYNELANVGQSQFEGVLDVLNDPLGNFLAYDTSILSEFIDAFPTLVWTLLLQTKSGSSI